MNKEEIKAEMIKVKFNALVAPKVEFNNKLNKFESVAAASDFRKDVISLMTEEGRNAEETKKFQGMKTSLLLRNGMMSLSEAVDLLYGSVFAETIRALVF